MSYVSVPILWTLAYFSQNGNSLNSGGVIIYRMENGRFTLVLSA